MDSASAIPTGNVLSTGGWEAAPEGAAPGAYAEDGLRAFLDARPRLFGLAYRMLGSAAEAEDVVQDVWIRWQTTDRRLVRNPTAFLVTTATRLAINVLRSARTRRETYVGPWLPEPVDTTADPGLGAERGEALNFAVLLLLETLSPNERGAYVLREAFNYPYREIAGILRIEEANARQLVTRARSRVSAGRRSPASRPEQRRLLEAFIAAARAGDVAGLERLFAADVVSTSDGGGLVRAARLPVVGRERVARFIGAIAGRFWRGVTLTWIDANEQSCVLVSRHATVTALVTVDGSTEGIRQVMWLLRPSKLAGLSARSHTSARQLVSTLAHIR